jgi:hypothetical protein
VTPVEFLKKCPAKCFYHFTDTRNLDSIRKYGLLSLAELKRQGVKISAPGGNQLSQELDARIGMDGYVHLCFKGDHPMAYIARKEGRMKETRFLQISPDALTAKGVRLTAGVANRTGVEVLDFQKASEVMDFEVIYARTNWKDPKVQERLKAAEKYEVLIPDHIPVKFISGF